MGPTLGVPVKVVDPDGTVHRVQLHGWCVALLLELVDGSGSRLDVVDP